MDTDETELGRFLAQTEPSDYEPNDYAPGDTSRFSLEAFVASATGTARDLASTGHLRLHGAGVRGTTADLTDVGVIATVWQKAVAAVGAAIEGVKSIRGGLPQDVLRRTALVLSASPSPGSVVLSLMPKADPLAEVAPEGMTPIVDAPRPLADRASERLIELLSTAATADFANLDRLSQSMLKLGPRVGGSLSALGAALERSNITLGADWREPERPTVRAEITPSQGRWIREFVAGRDLDAEEEVITGVLRTISDSERWLVDVGEKPQRMDAREIEPSVVAAVHVGQAVELRVRTAFREQPDGVTRRSYRILSVTARD